MEKAGMYEHTGVSGKHSPLPFTYAVTQPVFQEQYLIIIVQWVEPLLSLRS